MKNEQTIDNKVFLATVGGVALMVLTIVLALVNIGHNGSNLTSLLFPMITGTTSASLLFRAVKGDKREPVMCNNNSF